MTNNHPKKNALRTTFELASGRRSAERGSGHSLLVVAQPARILAANGRLRGRMAVSRPSIRREGAGSAPATQPSPPNSVGLRWSTWRRFDPSSSPSARELVVQPGHTGNGSDQAALLASLAPVQPHDIQLVLKVEP